jgi:hypothetical protein
MCGGNFVSNLLLITDMARLSKSFERLADDKSCSVRVVNNLEKGGEEIAIEKPDVVFVQTHLSGLSADILLKHLKKQLGRKRSRFVLLANPGQVTNDILKPYQSWIDISCEDSQLLPSVQNLLLSLLPKGKAPSVPVPHVNRAVTAPVLPEPETVATQTLELLTLQNNIDAVAATPVASPVTSVPVVTAETSLEEQGITYSSRPRLSVYSEFNSSFDNAVNRAPEAEPLVRAAPKLEHTWNQEFVDTIETASPPPRSKRSTFLLWLAPVVVAVIIVTFLQKSRTAPKPVAVVAPPVVAVPPAAKTPEQSTPVVAAQPTVPQQKATVKPEPDSGMSDKAVITAIAENRGDKTAASKPVEGARISDLPDFIPRYGFDKQYGSANPGWERYKGQVTEFKVLREGKAIKAIQVVDRGGQGVPESFMKGVLRQVAKKPVLAVETSEKKEGYEIQKGRVSENISVVYYRDEQGGRLRAFVMTWQ